MDGCTISGILSRGDLEFYAWDHTGSNLIYYARMIEIDKRRQKRGLYCGCFLENNTQIVIKGGSQYGCAQYLGFPRRAALWRALNPLLLVNMMSALWSSRRVSISSRFLEIAS